MQGPCTAGMRRTECWSCPRSSGLRGSEGCSRRGTIRSAPEAGTGGRSAKSISCGGSGWCTKGLRGSCTWSPKLECGSGCLSSLVERARCPGASSRRAEEAACRRW